MLRNLYIQNYALIDELRIEFNSGLNTITGETGAGKSILLGALSLILGQRADASSLKDKTKNCVVEGLFEVSGYKLEEFFELNDLDFHTSTIVRRQINEAGKSRAFINEIPVNLNLLKELGDRLIDIHSQHQNLLLSSSSFQIGAIDSFTQSELLVMEYHKLFAYYKKLKGELSELEQNANRASTELDYIRFQLQQLNDANIKPGEHQELELLQQELSNAEEIKNQLLFSLDTLDGSEQSVNSMLKTCYSGLQKVSKFSSNVNALAERLESCRTELRDIAHDIGVLNDRIAMDPEQLSAVNSRLDLFFTLQQKHRVASADDLLTVRDELNNKLNAIVNYDLQIEAKRKELDETEGELGKTAKQLSTARRNGFPKFQSNIELLLKQLGIPHARFEIEYRPLEQYQPTGIDSITFLFSANKQIALQELSKVASGGEISRLMLSIKSLMLSNRGLPTIIFDEIDTGVSGEVADKMGNIINHMGNHMQVVNITHLPQIASKGNHHYLVYKDSNSSQSKTLIKLLSPQERVIEIAKMLSGESLSEAALENAKHLLSNQKSGKT